MADDWDVVIDSLGNSCLAYLRPADVEMVQIWSQAIEGTAHIELKLRRDSHANRARAIDTMVEMREMYIDDLSFDYRFVDGDDDVSESSSPVDRVAQFATR